MQNQFDLETMPPHFHVQWFDQVDSTNSRLLEKVRLTPDLQSGTILAARVQTAGRGRLGRKWVSSSAGNLLFSLYYRTEAPLCRIPSLIMAVAIAIDDMLHDLHVHSNLKWPNDIQVNGRKIAGLLAERAGDDGVVIGVGLNVNMTVDEMAQIDQPATSLRIETGVESNNGEILNILISKHLPPWIACWDANGFSGLRARWIQGCGGLNTPISIRDGTGRIQGTLEGYGENGELLLRLPGGVVQTVWAGNVVAP